MYNKFVKTGNIGQASGIGGTMVDSGGAGWLVGGCHPVKTHQYHIGRSYL